MFNIYFRSFKLDREIFLDEYMITIDKSGQFVRGQDQRSSLFSYVGEEGHKLIFMPPA